jgi:hypothetical protein
MRSSSLMQRQQFSLLQQRVQVVQRCRQQRLAALRCAAQQQGNTLSLFSPAKVGGSYQGWKDIPLHLTTIPLALLPCNLPHCPAGRHPCSPAP